jgi:hypothetical protein
MLSKFLIINLIILLTFQFGYAQRAASAKYIDDNNIQDTTQKILPVNDELVVDVRLLPDDRIEEYKNDPDFNYNTNLAEPDDWITKIKNWINQQLATLTTSEAYSTIFDYIYYALMIIALILIARGLLKADRRSLLFGKSNSDELKMNELNEDIRNLNFDDLISSAIETKNYKLAIRYLYLKSLQLLSDQGVLELKENKTNHQYLSEIKNSRLSGAFRNVMTIFEWIWYGEFSIDESTMNNSQDEFNELFGLIESR